ncbi:UDP-glucose 4-epimerase GalE [Acholeplasma equirhinis]|uniref:UDP-glucose 4-epimerase GalE n=1 Tax=Acholeplasma equirhinis TaxID=555393 RepID=UPI00197A9D11|nr:UDP-glucose 4-epimerase GalE [Acholeplasma equirhinis]MBN3490054.1 UDP-glucose 4-epimerase GalE [Acholeplasma equirhinis]
MNVLVVGGAGYIGSHTVYELLRAGNQVSVMDNLSTGERFFVPKQVPLYIGDIRKKEDVLKVLDDQKFDVVMHFAAKLIVPESVKKPLDYYHNNVEGVRTLLEAMVEKNVKNIVFSSTAAVYGEPTESVVKEDSFKEPINPYGESKLACEKLIHWTAQAHDLNYVIFRYFNVAGADSSLEIGLKKQQLTHLIPVTIEAALGLRKELVIFGDDYETKDGTNIRDYIHVTDLAIAHVVGAKYLMDGGKSDIFNLGSAKGYSNLEVANTVSKFLPVPFRFGPRREGDPAILIADASKAKRVLGWQTFLTLEDIITSDLAYREKISKER